MWPCPNVVSCVEVEIFFSHSPHTHYHLSHPQMSMAQTMHSDASLGSMVCFFFSFFLLLLLIPATSANDVMQCDMMTTHTQNHTTHLLHHFCDTTWRFALTTTSHLSPPLCPWPKQCTLMCWALWYVFYYYSYFFINMMQSGMTLTHTTCTHHHLSPPSCPWPKWCVLTCCLGLMVCFFFFKNFILIFLL